MNTTDHTIVSIVKEHAKTRPESIAFTVLENGEVESGTRTFAELHARAVGCASWLSRIGMRGKTALLLLREPLEFIETFLGCLYAGVIAVPIAVPRSERQFTPVRTIAENARVAAVLSSRGDVKSMHAAMAEVLPSSRWEFIDDVDYSTSEGDGPASPGPDQIAFIQYTSGSTGSPRGVVVTHRNLILNETAIQRAMGLSERSLFVGWLPLYHDMGLIGNVIQPLYLGIRCVLMSPMAFLQRPLRWLLAISRYRATISGAPNFAYDLCVERIPPHERTQLDLSSWTVAFNGSEPVKVETLERFAGAFEESGFRMTSFYPCYGMAEATLMVTGVTPQSAIVVEQWDEDEEQGTGSDSCQRSRVVKRLVGCGGPVAGTVIAIASPEKHARLPDGKVGEIWVMGDSVSGGYYNSPEESQATFGARLWPSGQGPFLRTGDLGFILGGQLFVTGRIKDLIIVRGRNHYPQDLEMSAERSNAALAQNGGAAFALDDEDSLVVVHELTRKGWRDADAAGVAADVVEAIATEHGLRISAVYLIKPGTLPRTSSGKVKRRQCRQLLVDGALELLPKRPVGLPGGAVVEHHDARGTY
jgi:acyl-CoA synthetase (AMP-forming)/AMP-acid ligase II